MAIITPFDNKSGIWLVAGDQVGENSIDEVAQTILSYAPAINAVWVKTSDGSDWMAKYDTKAALHIDGPAAIDRWVTTLQKYGLEFHAWAVPRGLDIDGEAAVIIAACQRPGVRSMILDVEPYAGFYAGGQQSVRPLMTKIRAAVPGAFHIAMTCDARQAHYNEIFPQEWFPFVNSVHPQVYWPDMGVTPDQALSSAYTAWGNYGKPVIPALSAYGTDPSNIDKARNLAVNTYHAVGFSWWAFGHIDATHFLSVNHTVGGVQVVPPPGAAGTPVQAGTPIVVNLSSPNYHDGVYDATKPGFNTYDGPNGLGKFRAVDEGVANVWASYDPQIKQSGWYRIEAFMPSQHATTGNARYKIHGVKENPNEWLVSAAQSAGVANDWLTIGTFQIDATQPQPGVIFLNDWTFEMGREIVWDAIRWTPLTIIPSKATASVDVPYRSQEGANAAKYRNDCGPACVAMLVDWYHTLKGLPAVNMTIDQYAGETTLSKSDTGLRSDQLIPLAAAHGLPLKLTNNANLQAIMAEITAGRPTIALISYGPLISRENKADSGGHFVIVTGYDSNNVYVNDPDWWNNGGIQASAGHNWQIPMTQFTNALRLSPVPNQGCFIVPS